MYQFQQKAPVFKSPEDEKHFQEQGYVRKRFLEEEDIVEIRKRYEALHPNGVKGFYTTTYNRDSAHRAAVEAAILEVALPRIEALFKDYQIFFGSFIVKDPGPKSELNLHMDMSLVDESKYSGINIWCPLIDLNETNGAIEVIPKSHLLFPTYRGASIPDIYDGMVNETRAYLQPMHLKAGEAIVFNQSIIHYSPANLSDAPRPVINIFVSHKDARILICYHNKEEEPDKIEFFEQEDDFLRNFQQFGDDIFSRPKIGRSVGFKAYNFPKLTVEKLEAVYGPREMPEKETKIAQQKTKGFFSRLFSKSSQ